jgi:hypothetical protein
VVKAELRESITGSSDVSDRMVRTLGGIPRA